MYKHSIKGFITKNKNKRLTLAIYFYTAWYRFLILTFPSKFLQKHWGESGAESQPTETRWHYQYAYKISSVVNRTADHTNWESKCLVRALTARKLLLRKGISCTLYLGVGKDEDGKMIAHAWLRTGEMYVTGGDGTDYATVAKFAS